MAHSEVKALAYLLAMNAAYDGDGVTLVEFCNGVVWRGRTYHNGQMV